MSVARFVFAVLICFAVGFASGQLASPDTEWFQDLEKPSFYPPGYLFGLVWSFLYVAMGAALYLVMEQTKEKLPYILFGSQLLLNFAWSPVFFGLQNITLAFVDVTLLLGVLVWTTIEFRKHSKEAMALLLPLVAWVAFATVLTASILALN